MASTIVASNSLLVQNSGAGRVLDSMQDGTLWCVIPDSTASPVVVRFYYSTDGGILWNESVGSRLTADVASSQIAFFIDKDNGAHIVYREFTAARDHYRY